LIDGVKRVVCVGSGLVGQGWASLFALAGYEVTLIDVNQKILDNAIERVEEKMHFLEEAGLTKNAERASKLLSTTTSLGEAVGGADFVQESVFESYPAKKKSTARWTRPQMSASSSRAAPRVS